MVKHHRLRNEETSPDGEVDADGGALVALVRVLLEDRRVVARGVLAALQHDPHNGDQLRVDVPTVVGVVGGLG